MIKAAIFDVDDTLYDQLDPFKNAFLEKFSRFAAYVSIEEIYHSSRRYSEETFPLLEAGEISLLEHNTHRMIASFADVGIEISRDEAALFQEAYEEEQHRITLLPVMIEVFERLLEKGIILGVLTNGPFEHQWMKVNQLGITKWIPKENIFVSEGIGVAKPDPEAFHFVEGKLKLVKSTTVFIGDSFQNDIIGAKQAGWKAIWLNHRHKLVDDTAVVPDQIIYSPKELLNSLLFS